MSLEHLDTLVAFATVMLAMSLIITTLTQMVSAFLGLRGTNLRWGLKALIENIYPDAKTHAHDIAEAVLRHPLISDSSMSVIRQKVPMLRRWQLANHVTVGEFVHILDKMAGQTGAGDLKTAMQKLAAQAQLPSAAGVADEFQFWFETAMSRTAQRFSLHMRVWTIVFAVVLCLALHLDSLQLYTQLSSDAQLRAGLVTASSALTEKAQQQVPADADQKAAVERLAKRASEIKSTLDQTSLQLVPTPYPAPWYEPYGNRRHLLGVFFTIALLCLGAPFWFNVLKSVSSLKPLLASKQEDAGGAHS
ncbi:hypothetical protein [uncultured Paludibaculum sp.]|uniref:hypothetical protein n=1 Tax=uncultured Paludibaculum sp. TaxID=1765020 RepID=UPI002AABC33F|nr:hypothetical protein [uncultured Paludibaculum sp.]